MLSRRTALLALASSGWAAAPARAEDAAGEPAAKAGDTVTTLRVQSYGIEVNRKPATVLGIFQPDGKAGIVTQVGRPFRVRVENRLDRPTLIHWHGLTPPWHQDGVPGISGPPIAPGATGEYDFPLRFGGTFWMHSHQGLQEQELLAAPLIIHDGRDNPREQEIVVQLADFSFEPPEQIFDNLRKRGSMAGMPAQAADQPGGMRAMAPKAQAAPSGPATRGMATGAAAAPDLNDVTYDAFLANLRTLDDPDIVRVEPGSSVLLRIINSSAMSAYHVDLGSLAGEVIAVDGFEVRPVSGRRFPLAVAQRLDIRVTIPRGAAAYPVLATLEGGRSRSGVILQSGSGAISRVPAAAAASSPALTLDFEEALRAAAPLKPRKADRVHQLDLTGEMSGYVWSINGVAWTKDVPPLPVAEGERVELVFQNKTGMPHPMHLHGHEFQVVEIDGRRFAGAVRDTVLVTPGTKVVVAFDANNP
ncbi:MAG: multicopper oxidase domain-containing protein, partial [Acetobacteraceae bacterium]|nr:multicopper oxidase domain-containing protein [Acetobacteraceae bacterium]